MKRIIVIVLGFYISVSGVSAQDLLFDQWFLNNYLINPAITGIERFADLQLGYRNQWYGMEGAPQKGYLSFHSPTKFDRTVQGFSKTAEVFVERGVNAPKPLLKRQHGFGGSYLYDISGAFISHELNMSYAYHVPISRQFMFSTGLSGGVLMRQLDLSKIDNQVQSDPSIALAKSEFTPTIKFGVWLYSSKLYAGASAFTHYTPIDGMLDMRYYFNVGYRFDEDEYGLHLTPYGILRLMDNSANIDMGMKVDYNRRFWVGATYRTVNDLVAYAGFAVGPLFSLSYIYNMGLPGTFNHRISGTHEVVLSFRLKNDARDYCNCKNW